MKHESIDRATRIVERVNNQLSIGPLKNPDRLKSPRFLAIVFGVISGFSVFYFLYFFRAYGIQQGISYSGHSHLFRSTCFGLLTFGYITVLEGWVKTRLSLTHVRSMILWYLGLVVLGSHLIFLLFNYFWNWQEFDWMGYLLIMKEFPLMMVLPLAFYLLLKARLGTTEQGEVYLSFRSDNGKDQLKVRIDDFLYANSSENYITIFYSLNGETRKHLIRKPLKILEQEMASYSDILKTHRSYLVNKRNVQSVTQNRGKVYLTINSESIPVSKRYQDDFLQ